MKFTRDIDDHFYLRPIPLSQLNNMEMSDTEKAAYQNPGYYWLVWFPPEVRFLQRSGGFFIGL